MMNRPAGETITVVLGLAVLLGSTAASPAAAQSKCQSIKYKAMGIAVKAKANCHAQAAKQGGAVDAGCLAAADSKLASKWVKAEAVGDCVTSGDAPAATAATDDCLVGAQTVVTPPATPCCNFADGSCSHGVTDDDCSLVFGGVPGPAGSVCSGATGTCGFVAPAGGRCCMTSDATFCMAGPTLDLSGCVPPDFLDAPANATCSPSGACTLVSP